MPQSENFRPVSGLSEIAAPYRGLYCDIWGVMHNGVTAYPKAVDALRRFRALHGPVVLITNAPRPSGEVLAALERFKIPAGTWDAVVSSGDVTRDLLTRHGGKKVYHLGPRRDFPVLRGINVDLVGLADADLILCTGLFNDEGETPEDYRAMLEQARARSLEMICANPDRVVEVGDRLHYCAGALAEVYEAMGGPVTYAGKPHPPIYALAHEKLEAAAGQGVDNREILAIGDSIHTDLAGAAAMGLDALFVTGGIHDEEGRGQGQDPEPEHHAHTRRALMEQCAEAGVAPRAMLRRLSW